MNADTLVNDVIAAVQRDGFRKSADGWTRAGEAATADSLRVATIHAYQALGVRPTAPRVNAVLTALQGVEPEPVDLSGLPLPSAEELASEAAYITDLFFMFSLTLDVSTSWDFSNEDVAYRAVPAEIRKTAFRAGMTAAAVHGRPNNPPTMRQVVNALIKRMAEDGRIKRP
ncbi:hypothetical protein ACIQY8_24175 [Streptomyces albidoflavus]